MLRSYEFANSIPFHDSAIENNFLSESDSQILNNFTKTISDVVGKDNSYKVPLIGGTGLRLLEKITGISQNDIFSSIDIDAFYCDTDETILKTLKTKLNLSIEFPHVDIHRFLRADESGHNFLQKFSQDDEGNLSSSMLRGKIKHEISTPLELIGIPLENGESIYTISPAISYHMYALRAIGGIKQKDWDAKKNERLLEINRRLNTNEFNMNLKEPHDYPELRQARHLARQGFFIPKTAIALTWLEEKAGRPLEKTGLSSRFN